MNSICRQFGRILAVSLVSFLATATVLAFTPTNSLAFFHELNSGTRQVAPSPKPTSSPKVKGNTNKKSGESFWSKLFKKSPKAAKPAPSPKVAKAEPKVKGTQDKKAGESAIGKFFKSIGKGLAAVGDFLWPFDGKTAKKEVKTGQAKASPAPTPATAAEQPKELAPTVGETATATGSVTVAVPNEITNDTLSILGNLIWGDSTADRLTLKGLLASDILLAKNKEYNLANSGERFKAGYFSDNVYIGDENRLGATGMNVKGSAYIETRSSGSIYLNPDSDNVYVGTSGNTSNLEVSNNLTVKGTITATAGSTTADSIDITPSTNIDALDITGTNITTADLIDLDGTATTTGDAIDINMANTRTSGSAILITDASVAATVTGDLIQINISGTPDTNIIDIDAAAVTTGHMFSFDNTGDAVWTGDVLNMTSGTGDASGDYIDMTFEAGATDLQGIVVANAAASDQAGWLMKVDTTGIFTTNMFDIDLGAQLSTGDIVNVSMGSTNVGGGVLVVADAGGARTDALIDITTASTGSAADAAAIMQINSTGVLNASANVLDINMSGGAASNVIDITTLTTAFTGNMIALNFGAVADTGDAINIALGATAVAAQALVVTATGASTTDGWVLAADNTGNGIWTGDMINIRTGTGDASGDVFDLTMEAGATDAQAFVIANAAASDQAGWLMKVDTTGIFTTNMFDIDLGAQLSTGDIVNVSMGSTNVGGGVLVVADAGGARTDALIDITTASTGSAADAAAIMQINSTGDLDDLANVLDINMSGGTNANVIDITTLTTAFTGNLVDLNFGNIADTGDAINIGHGAAAVGVQAMVVNLTAGGLTNTDGIFNIDLAAGNAAVDGINLSLTANDGITDDTDIEGMVLSITANDVTADMFGMRIVNAATAAVVGADDTECLLCLDNAEDTAAVISDAIRITNSGATDTAITVGLDFDATGIVTDIELQNTETIANNTDDSIVLTGAGGTNNETFTIDLDSVASSGATLSSGGTFVLVNDNLSVGIDGNTTESIATSDFAFSGNDLYVDDKFGVNGTASFDGNLWQGDGVTTTTKTTAFLFLGSTAGAPTGDPATPAGFAAIVWDTTNNKICADEEAAGGTWLCTAALTDIAEWMPAAGAESGDLVSVTNLPNPTEDPTAPFMLGKTTRAYDNKLVGVVSKYAEDAGAAQGYKLSPDYHAVTLVGRVPVKVTGENGPIAKGDYLTSSSTAGYAMKATKAGPVAGMALEAFSGDKGTVMAFIKAAWFDPVEVQKQAVLAALGLGSGSVLGTSTSATSGSTGGTTAGATSPLVGAAADGSLGVLSEEVDLLVHGLLTATNLRVTTAAEFAGTLVVKGLATFEGDLVVKGAFSTGSLDLTGALTRTMTAGSDLSAGDPVVVTGANTVARAGGPSANVVGLAASNAAAGGSVKVAVAGTVGGYSGLSTGSRYYVGSGGVVTTAPGGDKAVHIGIAVSGSEMIVQIFESAAPPAPPVVDTATVDTGPTVSVSGTTTGTSSSTTESTPSSTPTPEPSPTPTPEPSPVASPTPSPEPSPSPTP